MRGGHCRGTIWRMPVEKWTSSDHDIGTPVFSEHADPAMSHLLVHFVGRQRGGQPVPQHVRHFTTEQRLVNILQMRQLFGFEVPRGQAIERCVCPTSPLRSSRRRSIAG